MLFADALFFVAEAIRLVEVVQRQHASSVIGLAVSDKRMPARVITIAGTAASPRLELFIVNLEVIRGTAKDSAAVIK